MNSEEVESASDYDDGPNIVRPDPKEAGKSKTDNPEEDDDGVLYCPICTEEVVYACVGECDHAVCHVCCLRMRSLYKAIKCALCKTDNISVIVYEAPLDRKFKQFERRSMIKDKKLNMYFENGDVCDNTLDMLRFNCPDTECDVTVNSWKELRDHVRKAHSKVMCDVCVKHKKIFAHEHLLFSQSELMKHKKHGDSDPSFKGHPECGYCSEFFYSADELLDHNRKKHEECHLCRHAGIRDKYYRDYKDLEGHFDEKHFMCKDAECLEKKFIVFNSNIDLKAHTSIEHASKLSKQQQRMTRKIDLTPGPPVVEESSSSPGNGRFRSKLTAKPNPPPAAQVSTPNDQLHSRMGSVSLTAIAREEWPSLSAAGSTASSSVTSSRIPLNVSRVFDALHDQKLAGQVSLPSILEHEAILAPRVASAVNQDVRKWTAFKALCINYLRGAILAERWYSEVEQMLGEGTTSDLFPLLVNIFPQNLRAPLLRVSNDKKLRNDEFPDLTASITPIHALSAKSKLLITKSKNKKMQSTGKSNMMTPWNANTRMTPGKLTSKGDLSHINERLLKRPGPPSTSTSQSSLESMAHRTTIPDEYKADYRDIPVFPSAPQISYASPAFYQREKQANLKKEDFPALPKVVKKKPMWTVNSNSRKSDNNMWATDSVEFEAAPAEQDKKGKKKVLIKFG